MKNNVKTYTVNEETANYIQGLQYERDARRDLLAFMLAGNMDTGTEAFRRYHTEYMDFYQQYNLATMDFERIQLPKIAPELAGRAFTWNLDFSSREVTVTMDAGDSSKRK